MSFSALKRNNRHGPNQRDFRGDKIERRRIKKSLFGPTFTESAQGQCRWLLGLCKPSSRLHSIYRWQGWQVCQDSEELVKSSHASQAILFYDFLSHPLEVDSHQHGSASVPHRDRHYYPAHRQSSTLIRYRASNIAWILAFLFSNIHWHPLNIESMILSLPHYLSLTIIFAQELGPDSWFPTSKFRISSSLSNSYTKPPLIRTNLDLGSCKCPFPLLTFFLIYSQEQDVGNKKTCI